jgi:hypothetical protein
MTVKAEPPLNQVGNVMSLNLAVLSKRAIFLGKILSTGNERQPRRHHV